MDNDWKKQLDREKLAPLMKASWGNGLLDLVTTWGMIAGALALSAWYPHPITWLFSMMIIGGRQLALAILMHDASHHAVFPEKWANNFFGKWFFAAPVWQDLLHYRVHHLGHHQLAGTPQDPDVSLVKDFPITKKSMVRKMLRDLTGISGLKRVYGLLLMDFGFIHFTAAADTRPTGWKLSLLDRFKMGTINIFPVALTNLIFFGLLWLTGHPGLYLLWVGAYLIFFSLFVRIRSFAEHACMIEVLDPFGNTRTTKANFLARLTVAPHHVNYHLEHHLFMTIPSYNLKKLHHMLREKGLLSDINYANGYLEVLKKVITV